LTSVTDSLRPLPSAGQRSLLWRASSGRPTARVDPEPIASAAAADRPCSAPADDTMPAAGASKVADTGRQSRHAITQDGDHIGGVMGRYSSRTQPARRSGNTGRHHPWNEPAGAAGGDNSSPTPPWPQATLAR
jgi:hypothetical protein